MLGDQALPLSIDRWNIRHQRKDSFKLRALSLRFCRAHAQAILLTRACSNHPKLVKGLREDANHFLATYQSVDGFTGGLVHRVRLFNATREDVRIDRVA